MYRKLEMTLEISHFLASWYNFPTIGGTALLIQVGKHSRIRHFAYKAIMKLSN